VDRNKRQENRHKSGNDQLFIVHKKPKVEEWHEYCRIQQTEGKADRIYKEVNQHDGHIDINFNTSSQHMAFYSDATFSPYFRRWIKNPVISGLPQPVLILSEG